MIKQWSNKLGHIGNYRARVDIKQKKPLSATVYVWYDGREFVKHFSTVIYLYL